ncbi:MAG: methyltransferase domain-containing protein [Candidatus Binataceae bacterium]
MADWNPELYNRFRRYRAEPFEHELTRLEFGDTQKILDLGCGSGENTIELARRAPRAAVVGLDSSPAMLDTAAKLHANLGPEIRARLSFVLADIRNYGADSEYSLVISNAALQWTGDHRAVLAACLRVLRPGGTLVIQMPANYLETAQRTILAIAREEPWREALAGVNVPSRIVSEPEEYSSMLTELGFDAVDCYYRPFHHPMSCPADIVEWSRATALRPFLNALAEERHADYLAALTRRLEDEYGTRGPLKFNFRRIFLWARRRGN